MLEVTTVNIRNTPVFVALGEHSADLFSGFDVTPSGLTLQEALSYPETENDAYIYGLVNETADGSVFFFTNTTRLYREIEKKGILSLFKYLGHEIYHLANNIALKHGLNDEEEIAELIEEIYQNILHIFLD